MASSGWQGGRPLVSGGFGWDYFLGDIRIDSITHSGNQVHISGAFGIYNNGNWSAYYVYPIYAKATGMSGYIQLTSNSQYINQKQYGGVVGFSTTISAAAGATSATIGVEWSYNNGTAYNYYEYTIYFDASAVAPSTPAVAPHAFYAHAINFGVEVSSYGSPSNADGRYIEAGLISASIASPTYYDRFIYRTARNTSSSMIWMEDSQIQSNTNYKYGAYANNTVLFSMMASPNIIYTAPEKPTATNFSAVEHSEASFSIVETSQGSAKPVRLQYRYKRHIDTDYSEWTNAGSVGNQHTRNVTLTGLEPSTSYDIQIRSYVDDTHISEVTTYEAAFITPIATTITIMDTLFEYQDGNVCQTTFPYVITAPDTVSEFDLDIEYVDEASGMMYLEVRSNMPKTGNFVLNLRPETQYKLTVRVGLTGSQRIPTEIMFVTPSFNPTINFVSASKHPLGKELTLSLKVDFGFGMTSSSNENSVSIGVEAIHSTGWGQGTFRPTPSSISTGESNIDISTVLKTYRPGVSVSYPDFVRLWWTVKATNKAGITTSKTIVTELPPHIVGKVIDGSGQRLNIVGSTIKAKGENTVSDFRAGLPIVAIK